MCAADKVVNTFALRRCSKGLIVEHSIFHIQNVNQKITEKILAHFWG
jgi:hypothetical protein